MKVEVIVLGSPSLTVLMVPVDIKQHTTRTVRGKMNSYGHNTRPGFVHSFTLAGLVERKLGRLQPSGIVFQIDAKFLLPISAKSGKEWRFLVDLFILV